MARNDLPPILVSMRAHFERSFGTEFRGTLLRDLLAVGADGSPEEAPPVCEEREALSEDLYQLLLGYLNGDGTRRFYSCFEAHLSSTESFALDPHVSYRNQVVAKGATFTTYEQSFGNSQILFKAAKNSAIFTAQIEQIFSHGRLESDSKPFEQFFLVVRRFRDLSAEEQERDPYRRYPLVGAYLVYDELASGVSIISLDNVISHYASCPTTLPRAYPDVPLRVIVSLDRVRCL